MDPIPFFDEQYNVLTQLTNFPLTCSSGFIEYEQMDSLFSESLDILSNLGLDAVWGMQNDNNPVTCSPADVMGPQINLSQYWGNEWPDVGNNLFEVPAPDVLVPTQLTAPVAPISISLPSEPRTPKMNTLELPAGGIVSNGLLSPPPSDRPVRTRRHNAYDELCQLSKLQLNTPRLETPATKSGSVFATPLPPTRTRKAPVVSLARYDEMRYLTSPSSSCSSSSSSSSSSTSISPTESPSINMSDTFETLSPPVTPVRRPTRHSGAGRSRVSRKSSADKPRSLQYNSPTPSGDSDRPYGCRHPGNIVPGDVPCDKDFARMHDWVRHQRVHNGQTPYKCLGCGKHFKRSDARGRHWDSPSNAHCEAYHTRIIRELLLKGSISAEHADVPILRRRAQKTACQKTSKRTGIPVHDLKAIMQCLDDEDTTVPGF
ncbi:Zinc finger and btb [Rhizoctonia solani]|uniref:Zinc finger and btb n=1 Tax=Rhizoctonia solani TaxID=456999 RepID=A0A8H7HFH5_9AGAM|nr:Zinc finger and btb [Rhizoctonia solani]